jgi:hypothetical protein
MSLVERLLRITMCLWPSGSPTWRKRTSEFCFAALAEYPERAMVLVREEPEAAGGARAASLGGGDIIQFLGTDESIVGKVHR